MLQTTNPRSDFSKQRGFAFPEQERHPLGPDSHLADKVAGLFKLDIEWVKVRTAAAGR